jgi:cytochrome d ubiquinol oxidase subunit II
VTAVLPGFWFGVIAVLWAGFFLLEGFDFGVGVLLPWVGRDETGRQVALRAIGPVWDGNEVWLIVAGGATFAAFPSWYASMFAGLYIPLALILAGLIVRGISIEYRSKVATASGRAWCDRGMFIGSLLPALLFGVAFADLIRGLHMNADRQVTGGFLALVSPFGLLGGLVSLGFFSFHGAVFLALRSEGPVRERAHRAARLLAVPVVIAAAGFLVWSFALRGGAVSAAVSAVMAVALIISVLLDRHGREGLSFASSAVVAMAFPVFVFASLWPDVIPARNHAAWSLTVHNASSNHYALVVMTVVAVIFTPIVLLYQGWAYWVFRARVSEGSVSPMAGLPRPVLSASDAYRVTSPPDLPVVGDDASVRGERGD